MKHWISFLLSLYILFCTVVPFTVFDNCKQDEMTSQTSDKDCEKNCSNCSPFSMCSSTPVFTFRPLSMAIEPLVFEISPFYNNYYFSSKPGYYPSFFQPPRIA